MSGQHKGRCLTQDEINKIVTLLSDAYKPDYRDLIVYFLSGWMRKAGICYKSARRVIEELAKEDEELDQRIHVLDRTYGLRGNSPKIGNMMNISGLQEVLERIVDVGRALYIIKELQDTLGIASPYTDSIIGVFSPKSQIYVIANPIRQKVVLAEEVNGTLEYLESVFFAVPIKLTVYSSPRDGIKRYKVVFERKLLHRLLTVGPATLGDIVGFLRAKDCLVNSKIAKDVLAALFDAYIEKGKAEVKLGTYGPGFYWYGGKIVTADWELKKPTQEELREALILLDELGSDWFSKVQDKFATVIKWGLVAPFSFIFKQVNLRFPWPFLYGATFTGKSTLALIVIRMWGRRDHYLFRGYDMVSLPLFYYAISRSTLPAILEAPYHVLSKKHLLKLVRDAIENTIGVRRLRGKDIKIPLLTPFILVCYRPLPNKDMLEDVIFTLRFTRREELSNARIEEFNGKVKPKLTKLQSIGQWVAHRVVEQPDILGIGWENAAEKLLSEMYNEAGLIKPKWISLIYNEE